MLNRALLTLFLICASQLHSFAQVLGVPLYSWDFAGGLPATWTNGSTSNIGVWEYRGPNTVPSNAVTSRGSCAGGSSAFNSVTQSNGFMIFDSNYWDDDDNQCGGFGTGPDPGPHTAWLISNSFSLAGVTGAVVTYQQQFRNYSSTIKVQYSINNGTSWVDMVTQSDFPGATAEWKSATFPAGAIGQTNVKLRFLYSGSYYHWAIDDITVFKPSINNLAINNTRYTTFGNTSPVPPNDFHDLPYDRYPKTMLVPFKFNAKATNIGSATQTGTNLNVKVLNSVNTAIYNQTTANSNVVAGATGNYTLTTGFTPSTTTGYFRIAYQINQTQTDEAPSNNRDTLDYFVTDYQYARDEGPMEDEFTPSALYAGQIYQVGNIFQGRSNTVKCSSIAVAVGPGTAIGTTIQAKIYRTDFTNLQATSVVYPVNAWDINALGQQKLITLQLPTPLQLMVDSIYIVMVENTVGSQAFKVCRSGAAIDQTSFVRYPENNGLFFMAKMPVVRMNLFTLPQTAGCMNPLANNYVPSATIDDGSCDIPGCIYPTSSNYNPNATWYDGSCVVNGCTIPTACNYSPIATVNDGSCILPTTYYADSDSDTFGNLNSTLSACSQPSGYVINSIDCNDSNSSIYPNALEVCNTFDDDCDGLINEGFSFITYYADSDGDGFGNPNASLSACSPPAGYVTNNGDCNDANAQVKPGAVELCNLIDDNCNGQINEGLVFVNYYIDTDQDGFGAGAATNSCTPIFGNYVTNNLDCNNNNASIRPNAIEICNSIDDNCNNLIDDGLTFVNYYIDADGDGYGAGNATNSCSNLGAGYATNNTDCNNFNADIRPNAIESCNGIDDNCNNAIDDGIQFLNYYLDVDHDGYYLSIVNACASPGINYSTSGSVFGDCNDTNFSINAGAAEICGNLIDENCDGLDEACIIPGCTNPIAINFNANANQDDGSCLIAGCTDPNADNFNPQANNFDNSCIYYGCIDPFANNFDPSANTNDFSCEYNTAAISVSDVSLCQNESITVYNQTLFSANDSCVINFGDGTILNTCNSNYTHSYIAPGEYVIEFIYFQGNTSSFASSDLISVNQLPESASISLNFPELSLNFNQIDTFEWIFNGVTTDITDVTFNASTNYSSDGFFHVKLTNEFSCETYTDSIYFVLPTYTYNQSNPCGPNEVIFENTTTASQQLDCHFENSNLPGNTFASPYTYSMGTPETFTVSQVCSAFGNNYYSVNDQLIESYDIPVAPILSYASNTVLVTNNSGYQIQWFLNNTPIELNPVDQSVNTFFNNNFQNGNYAAVYTNEFGCTSDTGYYFVIEINASATVDAGCYPLNTTIVNNTSTNAGIQCEILIPGMDYTPIVGNFNYTFLDPGVYEPLIYCYSGTNSNTYTVDPITVYDHPVAPQVSSVYGQVTLLNNSAGNSVQWNLDGSILNESTDSISTYINGIYNNGYYSATYTDSNGCSTSSDSLLVIQPRYELISGAGCSPVTATLSNTTDPVDGLTCVINDGLGGQTIPFNLSVNLTYFDTGNFAPEMTCSVGTYFGTYADTIVQVYPDPVPSSLNYSGGLITATDLPSSNSISWNLNGAALNLNTNPLNIGLNQISGYFYGTITNEFGCTSNTDSLLQIFPSFNLSQTQGCGPLSIQANNTTPSFNGMTCVLQSNGIDYPIDNFTTLNYSTEGAYNTSLTCSLDGSIFTAAGPSVTVFPNAPTPVLSWAYGAVLCSNCSGLSTQYFLDNIAFAQGSTAVSTLQNGVYQNGFYTAQSSSAQGCLSSVSLPVLVIQPVLNFTPGEGCAPLQSTFVNSTDYVEGLSCELFLGNGSGNIPLSYLETYSYSYSNPNTYSPYLSCTAGNTVANSPSASLVVNGGTTPELIFDAGFVNCANCANQDNITWIIDGTLTIDSISSVPDSLGSFYSCDYINQFGCAANAFIVSVIEETASSFNLFPNPVRDQLNITGLAQTSTLEIRDAQGRLVYQDLGRGASRTINTSKFSNGFYTITETSSKIFRSGTLLVNH
ncbi:MAG: MopE-related protein [Flavobacteriales bacterium]